MAAIRPAATDRRRKTRNDIYRYIYDASSSVTKQEIAKELNLSLPTVYQNLSELEEAGLIHAAELLQPSGGRPPVGYEVNGGLRYAIGIALSAQEINITALDLNRRELASAREAAGSSEEEALILHMTDVLNRFREENGLDDERLLGIGMTVPGVLDEDSSTILLSPTMKLKRFPVQRIREQFSCPVIVDNDSTCAGIAEYAALPASEQKKNLVYLHMEYGVGGAVFFNGRPWYGENHRSAEFGHMCIVPGGRTCNCGMQGCLEAYIGAFRFSRDLGIGIDTFFTELNNGNQAYRAIWEDGLDHLAIAVNNLHRAFDCDVMLGGFMAEHIRDSAERLDAGISERELFEESNTWLRYGQYPGKAGIYGAAWTLIGQFIEAV